MTLSLGAVLYSSTFFYKLFHGVLITQIISHNLAEMSKDLKIQGLENRGQGAKMAIHTIIMQCE